jgi:hypothetical protein
MPEICQCASCNKKVKIPERLYGKRVKCPACGASFVAEPQIVDVLPGDAAAAQAVASEQIATVPLPQPPRPAPPPVRDLEREMLSRRTQPLPGKQTAITLMVMLSLLMFFDVVSIGHDAFYRPADAMESLQAGVFLIGFGCVGFFFYLATAIIFFFWLYRAHSNLSLFRIRGVKYSAGWGIGSFFIPIMAAYYPCLLAQEMWRASDPEAPPESPEEWKQSSGSIVVAFWWMLWLVTCTAGQVSVRLMLSPGHASAQTVAIISIVHSAASIGAAGFLIMYVKRLLDRQAAKFEGRRKTEGTNVGAFIFGSALMLSVIVLIGGGSAAVIKIPRERPQGQLVADLPKPPQPNPFAQPQRNVFDEVGRELKRPPAPQPRPQPQLEPEPEPQPEPKRKGPPRANPNPGPAPKDWTVLFRSSKPRLWNSESAGEDFAIPLEQAHPTVQYLRLKRMDTGDFLIVPASFEQLSRNDKPNPIDGHWWNGTAQEAWGGRLLGIVQAPSYANDQHDIVGLFHDHDRTYSGSGFGWKTHVNDRTHYGWQGREIPKTAFEIAVKCTPLTEEERRFLAAPASEEGPAPKGWKVLFRSSDPADWNTVRQGESFAIPAAHAHSRIRFLRLKRVDTGSAMIVPVTRDQLLNEPRPMPSVESWWNGGGCQQWGAKHLGIARQPRLRGGQPIGSIAVDYEHSDSFTGSGFGHVTGKGDTQAYCWEGKPIAKTVFEVAVTADDLTAEERELFVVPDDKAPAPKGWVVLFRADDPSVWNTTSKGEKFAMPLFRAHKSIKFLRLTRMDTKAYQVIPISREDLTSASTPSPDAGWNGSSNLEYGGYHLGIVQSPRHKWPGLPRDLISVMNVGWDGFSGSGFGHKAHVNQGQFYCWQGKEIQKTAFEIAVTCDELTVDERRFLGTFDDTKPAPKGWMVLFRSNDPTVWNTKSEGAKFAIPVTEAHPAIKHLRLKRMDTGEAQIIPITRAALAEVPEKPNGNEPVWNGTAAQFQNGARLLGIAQGGPIKKAPAGTVIVIKKAFFAVAGSGFAGKIRSKDGQYYSWKGQEIQKTIFEIAVTAEPLTKEEEALLVK